MTAVMEGIPKSERARKRLLQRLIEEQQAELEAENLRWESRYDHLDDHEKEIRLRADYLREQREAARVAKADRNRKF